MASSGNQVKNGKAFEYALAVEYVNWLVNHGVRTEIVEDSAFRTAQAYFNEQPAAEQRRFRLASQKTIDTIARLEPGLTSPANESDILRVALARDSEGQDGDVRDVVFSRTTSKWEVGFSAKNNHEAVKHSRLSHVADFGATWLGVPCSEEYFSTIAPVFRRLQELKEANAKWSDIPDKAQTIYLPLLTAFRNELLAINDANDGIPQALIKYLVGKYPFYKIIKDDNHSLVIVKAFNLEGQLGKTVNGKKPQYRTPSLKFPTRIVEFEMKRGSDTTLNMILDEGWEVSFRLHNASSKVESSLKFDIQLTGNPPILFSQYLFQ